MQVARVVQVGSMPLVFGLDWIPLLGDEGRVSSVARRHGASHLALSGHPPAALGMAVGLSRRSHCWSAAALMAGQHPDGTVARIVALAEDCWHVLACHEGVALVRADRSYTDLAGARQAVDELRINYPQLMLHEDALHGEAISGSAIHDDAVHSVLQDLAQLAAAAPPLQQVRRRTAGWWGLGTLVPAVVAAASGFWPSTRQPAPVSLDPLLAWTQALDRVLARRPAHGLAGTRDLLQGLYRQPAHLAGWRLHTVRCEPGADASRWHCNGDYRRVRAGADNRGLLEAAPADWQLDFPSLDRAQARWSLAPAATVVRPAELSTGGLLARDWASALQEIMPAFSKLQVEPARPLAVVAPRDAQGHEIPRPPNVPVLATRALQVQGPLQSASLLVSLAEAVSWHRATLTLVPGARAGVRASRLMLHLEGISYENS